MATDLDLSIRQMINSQVTAWKIVSLNNLTQTYDFLNKQPGNITNNDRLIRDVYFANRLNIPENPTEPSFVEYAKDSYKDRKLKQYALEKKEDQDKFIKRSLFWKYLFWFNPKTKEESDTKKIIRKTAFHVATPSVLGFLGVGLVLYKITGISKMSSNVQLKGFFIFVSGGIYWTYFRLSDRVFKMIPPLPDKDIQTQRRHLMAQSIVTQGLFVEPMQDYDKLLLEANNIASGPEQKQIKKILIQNQGFRVFL